MIKFSELGVKTPIQMAFTGDKIKINKILNKEIVVHDWRLEDSKFQKKGNEKCLYLQIEVEGSKRIVFTGSVQLARTIEQIPREKFPFTTTIIENEGYEFS